MGLPYFITPTESDASAKPQSEKTAARARSSIRRQPRASLSALRADRYRRLQEAANERNSGDVPEFMTGYEESDAPAPPVARTPGDSLDDVWPESDERTAISAALARARAEIVDLRPTQSISPWARPSMTRADSSDPPMPAVPESGDFIAPRRTLLRRSHDSVRDLRREYRAARRRAIALQLEEDEAVRSGANSSSSNPFVRILQARFLRNGELSEFPPLQRVGTRTYIADFGSRSTEPRRFRQTPIPRPLNGLGDRDRSISPDNDGAWETIRTTLTPDPQPASLSSSFASAVASSSITPSANTSLTTMGSAEDAAANACDVEESNDSETDQDEDETDMYASSGPTWLTYANVVNPEGFRVARREESEDGSGLSGFQRIVRGLASRQDIPDEWWAEAGLSRTLPRDPSS